jgi:hypothetical protein
MNILYVTTFNKRLYNITGKNLIESFLNNNIDAKLLVCYENMDFDHESNKILKYDITNDEYLKKWLENNKYNIPKYYDGLAEDNDPRFIEDKKKGQSWARFRASGYFRKIVALNYALNNYSDQNDIIFTIDSDCIFKKYIDKNIINKLFENETSMIYYWGEYRRKRINRGPESGFIGYSKNNKGYEFAKIICECFISQDFLTYEYWDDGYVIGKLILENENNFNLKDLVETRKEKTTRVMELPNILLDYIHHFKNIHKHSKDINEKN